MTVVYKIKQAYANSADNARAAWVAKLMPGCEHSASVMQISPEAIVAQSALETGWGKKTIGNNVFGVKADSSWKGKKQKVMTREVINGKSVMMEDWFRDYDSVQDSIDGHLEFLIKNKRYEKAGVFQNASDEEWWRDLQKAGYATDPNYAAIGIDVTKQVKRYTANMERVELDSGYVVAPDNTPRREDINQSTIVKDSNKGAVAAVVATLSAALAPIVQSLASADWKVVAVIAGATVSVAAGIVAFRYFTKTKKTRRRMHAKGIG